MSHMQAREMLQTSIPPRELVEPKLRLNNSI